MHNKIQATPELLNAMDAIQIVGGIGTNDGNNQQCPCYNICGCVTNPGCPTYPNTCNLQQSNCGILYPCSGGGEKYLAQCAEG